MKKINQLREKLLETKEIDNLSKVQRSKRKAEIKLINIQNRIPKGEKNLPNKEGNIIDILGLNKTFISGTVIYNSLNNVSLSIKKSDFVVILGPSGSGKTTLLNLMSGLDRPTSGQIVVDGTNIAALTNRQLTTFRRNKVGFIFQSYNLLLELNTRDNAELGRQLQMDNNKRLNVQELLEKVGLKDKIKSSITELSGGQSQRVSIVRALSKNPDIIFADEPTGALDSVSSKNIINLFKQINKKYRTTIVIVTHDKQIANEADMIIEVKDGKVNVQTK